MVIAGTLLSLVASTTGFATAANDERDNRGGPPDFVPNVHVFTPSTPPSVIQATVDAIAAPTSLPAGSLHNLLTVFLDPNNGKDGILHVVNDTGGSSTRANPDAPVTVVTYPYRPTGLKL